MRRPCWPASRRPPSPWSVCCGASCRTSRARGNAENPAERRPRRRVYRGRMADLVIGADLGGTSTRLTVATTAGVRLATVEGGGGNPTTHGVRRAAAELARTARRALTGLDPAEVRAVV